MSEKRVRRCPELALSPLDVLSAIFRRASPMPYWIQFRNRRTALTQSCRTAIQLLRDALGLTEGDEVIMPAYNCGTEIDALLAAGLTVRFVDSDERGFLTLEALKDGCSRRTKAIYAIHLFGWPQPLNEIDAWRKRCGLLLIEDCALALFSEFGDGRPLGSIGEASVYSFSKSLPVPDGGALSWSTRWCGPDEIHKVPMIRILEGVKPRLMNWVRREIPAKPILRKPSQLNSGVDQAPPDIPKNYYFEAWRRGRGCSSLTARLLIGCRPENVRERRRNNYKALAAELQGSGLKLLFSYLPERVCPLSCPIVIDARDEVISALTHLGIVVPPWWAGGHRKVSWEKFPIANYLKRTILPLPVHQQLNKEDMKYIAAAVSATLARLEARVLPAA
jgi:dTDP-4-amino-4,6-dideoxygalactose transaminase